MVEADVQKRADQKAQFMKGKFDMQEVVRVYDSATFQILVKTEQGWQIEESEDSEEKPYAY